ncbi:MAG: Asp-tRNA(Asn)/Glu-tRNA(Gln) amidotransferase subunit GatC [Dialister invisus]
MNNANTEAWEPTAHAVEQYNVMREDEPHQSLSNEKLF